MAITKSLTTDADGLDLDAAIGALRRVAPRGAALHEPEIGGNAWAYVKDCLDTGWVSTAGGYVDRIESELARITGAARAVATVNGTAALHACLLLADVRPGDEVLMPTLTFVATANAVHYCGAVPHFVDSEESTLGVSPAKLRAWLEKIADLRGGTAVNRRTGRPLRALIAMHAYGHPVDLDPIVEICRRFGIVLIEDAAESLGSFYKNLHTGNHGRLAALSFNGNKIVTTGGGGAVLTNDPELGARAKHLTTTAKKPHRWAFQHDIVGFNYRMPNLNAALGCAQLESLDGFVARKRRLAKLYREAFAGVAGVRVFAETEFARSNYWLNVLLLDPSQEGRRDDVLAAAHEIGIQARPAWDLMHDLPMNRDCPRMDLECAESLYRRLINVPSSPILAGADV